MMGDAQAQTADTGVVAGQQVASAAATWEIPARTGQGMLLGLVVVLGLLIWRMRHVSKENARLKMEVEDLNQDYRRAKEAVRKAREALS